jgi:hypothetical protein
VTVVDDLPRATPRTAAGVRTLSHREDDGSLGVVRS